MYGVYVVNIIKRGGKILYLINPYGPGIWYDYVHLFDKNQGVFRDHIKGYIFLIPF
mgnify:FL=1